MEDQNPEMKRVTGSKTVLGLDVGTTTIKAIVINGNGEILGRSFAKTEPLPPKSKIIKSLNVNMLLVACFC